MKKENKKIDIKKILKDKKNIIPIIVMVIILIGGFVSFALLTDIVFLGQRENEIATCKFDVGFKDENPIRLESAYPLPDAKGKEVDPYTFYVKTNENTCEGGKYRVNVYNVCNECELVNGKCTIDSTTTCNCTEEYQIDENLIKYQLINTRNNQVIEGTNPYKIDYTADFVLGEITDSYELRLWIDESATNEDMYVYENGQPLENSDGTFVTKNVCMKLRINNEDTTAPVCVVSNPATTNIGIGETLTYTVTCTDSNGVLGRASAIEEGIVTSSGVKVNSVTRSGTNNEMVYTVVVEGTARGTQTATIPTGSIIDTAGNSADEIVLGLKVNDATAPECVFNGPPDDEILLNEEATYELVCTDETGLVSASAETVQGAIDPTSGLEVVSVSDNVTETASTYSIVVRGTLPGAKTITLDAGIIEDSDGNGNEVVISNPVTVVDNVIPTCSIAGPATSEITVGNTTTYTLTCSDNIGIQTTTENLKAGITTTSGLAVSSVTRSGTATNYVYTITVKGTRQGTQTITIPTTAVQDTSGNGIASAITSGSISVTGVSVTDIAVTSTTPIWVVSGTGKTTTATATVSPSDASLKTVTWSSSNTNVATVNSSTGVVTPITNGTVDICATSTDGSDVKGCTTINVNRVVLNSPSISSACNGSSGTNCSFAMTVGAPTVTNGSNTVTSTITNGQFISTGTYVYGSSNSDSTRCCNYSRWLCFTQTSTGSAFASNCEGNATLIKKRYSSDWDENATTAFLQDATLTVTPTSGTNNYYLQVMGLATDGDTCNALSNVTNPTNYNCSSTGFSGTTRSGTVAITVYVP